MVVTIIMHPLGETIYHIIKLLNLGHQDERKVRYN